MMQKSLSIALFSAFIGSASLTSTVRAEDDSPSSVIDLPDMQLQKKLREIEAKTEKQKAQLERRLKTAEQKAAQCPPVQTIVKQAPAPKCEPSDRVSAASVNSGTAAELDNLRRQLAAKDTELKKKEREVTFLKNALAQVSAKAQNAPTENQAAVPNPEPATPVATTPPPPPEEVVVAAPAEAVFPNRVFVQIGYGPNGTQQKTRADGALTVDQKFTPILGATFERMITPSWSVSGTVMSNKTAMGGVGYGF